MLAQIWSRYRNPIAWSVGLISGLIGIYVFAGDIIQSRVFPEQSAATKGDIQQQLMISDSRVENIVQEALRVGLEAAETQGREVTTEDQSRYQNALEAILRSRDPTLAAVRAAIEAGQPEAAAAQLTSLAADSSNPAVSAPASLAQIHLQAGDLLSLVDPRRALEAYARAQLSLPNDAEIAERVAWASRVSGARAYSSSIMDAQFPLSDLVFDFRGCRNQDNPTCTFVVTNPTSRTVRLGARYVSAIAEDSVLYSADSVSIGSQGGSSSRDIIGGSSAEISISFVQPAKLFQNLRLQIVVAGVEFDREFRDVLIAGGSNVVAVKSLRPIDPAYPDRDFTLNGIQFRFLGCDTASNPTCRFDAINTLNEDVQLRIVRVTAFDEQSIERTSSTEVINMTRRSSAAIPKGVVVSLDVQFATSAQLLQLLQLELSVGGENYVREFRNLRLADQSSNIDVMSLPTNSALPHFTLQGLEFAFAGCRGTSNPTCRFYVKNISGGTTRLRIDRASGESDLAVAMQSNSPLIQMTRLNHADIPPELTTPIDLSFKDQARSFRALQLVFWIDGERFVRNFTDVVVEP